MRRPRIVILSRQGDTAISNDDRRTLEAVADAHFSQEQAPPPLARAAVILRGVDVLGATGASLPELTPELLARVPQLSRIVLHATGTDAIDLDLLYARGITLTTLPDYATIAVAEHALGLLMALAQRIHLGNDVSRGIARAETSLRGIELHGRTILIVGLGRIGRRLAALAAGVGMRVLGSDPDPAACRRAAAAHVSIVPFDRVALGSTDVLALCASRVYGAAPVLDAAAVAALRPGAFVVNVGRPQLVDHDAVAASLRARHLRGYAVDATAFDPEANADLLSEGRILQTAHSAWWKDEALERGRAMWGKALIEAVESTRAEWSGRAISETSVPSP